MEGGSTPLPSPAESADGVAVSEGGLEEEEALVLVEDPISQEKRLLERRKNAKMEKAAKSISKISLEVDRLVGKLLKLDGIMAEGDVKLKREIQVKRVQKYVETLDLLKIKNSLAGSNGQHALVQHQQKHSNGQKLGPNLEQQGKH
ncbi:BAG family molecular chaperone regulator 1-like [Vigna radiata var. radiata]|uniref:BAG family molecular chaperone regulator 1-like n=1 Tax=Vigna radiata var. radiata TaxID=3916 RepID=A0A1S3UJK3_VIGRR|nr:BAG family molecular chaperone regulator 1-like [Vigna radiata var. radiata]